MQNRKFEQICNKLKKNFWRPPPVWKKFYFELANFFKVLSCREKNSKNYGWRRFPSFEVSPVENGRTRYKKLKYSKKTYIALCNAFYFHYSFFKPELIFSKFFFQKFFFFFSSFKVFSRVPDMRATIKKIIWAWVDPQNGGPKS